MQETSPNSINQDRYINIAEKAIALSVAVIDFDAACSRICTCIDSAETVKNVKVTSETVRDKLNELASAMHEAGFKGSSKTETTNFKQPCMTWAEWLIKEAQLLASISLKCCRDNSIRREDFTKHFTTILFIAAKAVF